MIELVCSDIDGTLLNKHREVDEATRAVVLKLKDRVEFVLASSRMPSAMFHIQEVLEIADKPLICYNGALILAKGSIFSPGDIIFSKTIPADVVQQVIAIAENLGLHLSVYHYDAWITSKNDEWAAREINNTKVVPNSMGNGTFNNMERDLITEAHKIMVMGEEQKIGALEDEISKNFDVASCRAKKTYLEITPANTNKSLALFHLIKSVTKLNHIGSENIMAFGDNHNDFELLRDVKYGIAVDNATRSLKEIAFEVTQSNIEHGVARYLAKYFFSH